MEPCERTDIVIVGGGFGGMNVALALDSRLKRGLKAEVTLISRSNFFLFTPLLVEVAAALVESRHVVNPIRRMLDRVRFIEGTVQTLDPVQRTVSFVDQNGRSRLLSYEHCVLAPGGRRGVLRYSGARGECADPQDPGGRHPHPQSRYRPARAGRPSFHGGTPGTPFLCCGGEGG